jgi:hypothetical protein
MSFTADGASTFVSEMLTLEPACDVEHGGALIVVDDSFTAPLNARGLQVHACDSSSLTVLSDHVRLSQCSDGGMCGDAATCVDVLPSPSAPDLTTVDCSCTGEFFPSPKSASLALAPYGFDPSVDYCVTPRVPTPPSFSGFAVEESVRLTKTASANAVYTLNLEIPIGGTDIYPAAWNIDAASVPSWLSLPRQGSIGATEKSGYLSVTASSAGLAERLATPYEALLNVNVAAQRNRSFLALVQLYVSAQTLANTSIWGRPTSERVCQADAASDDAPIEVPLGENVRIPFTACDLDGLAVDHDDPGRFEAVLIDRSSGGLHSLSVAYDLPGTYVVAVQTPTLGEFELRLSFDGESVGVDRAVVAVCPEAKEPLPDGLYCGCERVLVDRENHVRPSPYW